MILVRTFCVSPYGEVTTESYDGVLTVNGGSYAERKTDNTNFAILVSTSFTEPFKEPIAYGKYACPTFKPFKWRSDGSAVRRFGYWSSLNSRTHFQKRGLPQH